MNRDDSPGAMGFPAVLVGFVIVVFAYQFRFLCNHFSAEISFWINEPLRLVLIAVGVGIVAVRR